MELEEGEAIIKTGNATYKGGSDKWSTYASYGTLYLTNKRLVFEFTKSFFGMFLKRPKDPIEIPLSAIENVQTGGKDIPISFLVMKIDYTAGGVSKFLLLAPIRRAVSHTGGYGSTDLVNDWIAPIRRSAKLPEKSDVYSSIPPITTTGVMSIILIILVILIIIAIGVYIAMNVH